MPISSSAGTPSYTSSYRPADKLLSRRISSPSNRALPDKYAFSNNYTSSGYGGSGSKTISTGRERERGTYLPSVTAGREYTQPDTNNNYSSSRSTSYSKPIYTGPSSRTSSLADYPRKTYSSSTGSGALSSNISSSSSRINSASRSSSVDSNTKLTASRTHRSGLAALNHNVNGSGSSFEADSSVGKSSVRQDIMMYEILFHRNIIYASVRNFFDMMLACIKQYLALYQRIMDTKRCMKT